MLIPAAAASPPSALHLTGLCSAVDGGRVLFGLAKLAGGLSETACQFETRKLGYRVRPNYSTAQVLYDVVQAASRPIDRWSVSVFCSVLIIKSLALLRRSDPTLQSGADQDQRVTRTLRSAAAGSR